MHEKLKTGMCYVEEKLSGDLSAQNLLNRVRDADCIITCWTGIPDAVLERINPRAILTWTHEYEHRLNVEMAHARGIYTGCVADYGTDSVSELEFAMLIELIERNKKTLLRASTEEDIAIGVLHQLLAFYRKMLLNEKNTRKGKFSHQFHKIGRSLKHYGDISTDNLDEIIPPRLLQGKRVGILSASDKTNYLEHVLTKGFGVGVQRRRDVESETAGFYKLLAMNDFVIYDSTEIDRGTLEKIYTLKGDGGVDISKLAHYDETLQNKILGIIGLGRIGSRVAEIATAFGLEVLYCGNEKDVGYAHVSVDELLKRADVVSLNVKAHKVRDLLSAERIAQMKDGAYFINTSDGNALDQGALTARMLDNSLYVGLDVYPGLPTTKTLQLDDNSGGKLKDLLGNHVFTYRAGWATQESIKVKTYKLLGHMVNALLHE